MIGTAIMCLIAVSLHSAVLNLIRYERRTNTNGHLITRVFSMLEILMCFVYLVNEILQECNFRRGTTYKNLQVSAYLCLGLLYFLMSITITIDRFLEVYLNIIYPVYLTERHFYIAISFYLTCALFQTAFLVLIDFKLFHMVEIWSRKYTYPMLDAISISLTAGTYSYIFWKCSKRSIVPDYMKTKVIANISQRRIKLNCRQLCRLMLMVLSTLSSILPMCIYMAHGWDFNSSMLDGFVIICIKDGLLHMVFLENVREKWRSLIRSSRVQPTIVGDVFALSYMKTSSSEAKVLEWRENYMNKRLSTTAHLQHLETPVYNPPHSISNHFWTKSYFIISDKKQSRTKFQSLVIIFSDFCPTKLTLISAQ